MRYDELLILSMVLAIAGPLLIIFLKPGAKAIANSLIVTANIVATSIPALHVLLGGNLEMTLQHAAFFGDIPIRIDGLSAWFILIVNLASLNGAIYGIGYMKPYAKQRTNLSLHWMMFILFHASMVWVCMIQHSLAFLVVWEIMSLSSMMLVMFEHENKKTLQAGINYLVQMHIGVVFLTIAFIWVYLTTGSFDFKATALFFSQRFNGWLFLLFFIGFGIKAGFLPFHTWLPHAHPAGPSHISGVMSGVIVKLGIYGIFRIITYLKSDYLLIGESLLALSLITGMFGIINAAVHRDFKRMLAYCTIENIGIIGMGTGLGLMGIGTENNWLIFAGFGSALLHVLNHSLFKPLLFFAAGSVYQQTHTRNMEKLGGLLKKMPQTALFFLLGSIAIAGLPPFNGFISEFLLYSGFIGGIKASGLATNTLLVTALAGLAVIGGVSILTFTKSFSVIFLGNQRSQTIGHPKEVSAIMRIPQMLIVAIMLSVAVFPAFYLNIIHSMIQQLFTFQPIPFRGTFGNTLALMNSIGKYSLAILLLFPLIIGIRSLMVRKKPQVTLPTWGCGYSGPNMKMQYTGKSFSKTLGKLLNFIVVERKNFREITSHEIFPHPRIHSSHYADTPETIFENITGRMMYALNYFQFIQNGNTTRYVLYGLIFIILVVAGTFFKLI